jgi:hypothetical protein
MTNPPSGCNWCGHAERGHGSRWGTGVGFHDFVAPPQGLIKHRMRERRSRRFAAELYRNMARQWTTK